ncbi:hypothetical protein B7463_g7522, partial [Scytalidium lignicola]
MHVLSFAVLAIVAPAFVTSAVVCNQDNCLRNLLDTRYISTASTFCASYTSSVSTEPTAIPTWLNGCGGLPSRVSSACSCLPTSATSSFATTGTSAASLAVTSSTSSTITSSTSTVTSSTSSAATSSSLSLGVGYNSTASNTTSSDISWRTRIGPPCICTKTNGLSSSCSSSLPSSSSSIISSPGLPISSSLAPSTTSSIISPSFLSSSSRALASSSISSTVVSSTENPSGSLSSTVISSTASSSSTTLTTSSTASTVSPSTTSATSTTSTRLVVTGAPVCNGDNCLNALKNPKYTSSASAFCQTYTTTVNTDTAAIPTFLANCKSSPSRVSSACTCLMYTTSTTTTTTTTSTASTATPDIMVLFFEPVEAPPQAPEPTVTISKRQTYNAPGLIGDGTLQASCKDADAYQFTWGNPGTRLSDNGLIVGADYGVPNAPFIGSTNPGPVQGTFGLTNGKLTWQNESFAGGEASFCVLDNLVIAVFDGNVPKNCIPVNIGAKSLSSLCPDGTTYTTISGAAPLSSLTTFPTLSSATGTKATPTPTPSLGACGPDPETEPAEFIPAPNPDVDTSSFLNLAPSNYAQLWYRDFATQVLSVEYAMQYPQVTMENAAGIGAVTCSAGSITIKVNNQNAYNIINEWPSSNLVIVTNTEGCNPPNQRGVYFVSSSALDASSLSITLSVTAVTWTDVAYTMEVSMGIATTVDGTYSDNVPMTAYCSNAAPTITSSSTPPTATSTGVAYADLTPEEKSIVDFLTRNTTYDSDGNIVKDLPPVLQQPVDVPAPDPTNTTLQNALEQQLEDSGLSPPSDLYNKAQNGLNGYCSDGQYVVSPTKRSASNIFGMSTFVSTTPAQSDLRRRSSLRKREDINDETWWKWLWEIGCSEIVGAILEEFTDGLSELICDLKELYDDVDDAYQNRAAIECALTGCWMNVPTATYWDYTYSWNIDFGGLQNTVIAAQGSNTISCVDCSMFVSEVQFVGRVMIEMGSNKIISAYMTPTVSSQAHLLMEMKATGPFSGNFDFALSTGSFQPVNVPGEFTITPSMIYSIGVQWSTDSAVDVIGGATINLNQASLYLDYNQQSASSFTNWQPSVQFTYPSFTTNSKVTFIPIMRSALNIDVNILNAPYGQPVSIISETSIGFSAQQAPASGGSCPAGQLQMTSYSNAANSIVWGSGSPLALAPSPNYPGQTTCFNVPNDIPSAAEIASLRSVGEDFCTSYIGYSPPTSAAYAVSTVTTPSTVGTTVTQTITTDSTVYLSTTQTSIITITTTVPSTSFIYTSGTQALGTQYLKRGLPDHPVPTTLLKATLSLPTVTATPTPQLGKRQVPAPTFISTWDSSKISYGCSQVATGTVTKTFYTSTSTSYSGTVTSTATAVSDVLGKVVTSNIGSMVYSLTAVTTTVGSTTATTATSCPLQTQVSCFSITGHGQAHVDGKKLSRNDGYSSPMFGPWPSPDFEPAIFYLTCAGHLVSLPSQRVLIPQQDEWVEFSTFQTNAPVCTQDPETKSIVCGSGWYTYTEYPYSTPNNIDMRPWMPLWQGDAQIPYYETEAPVALTYDEVECPCAY